MPKVSNVFLGKRFSVATGLSTGERGSILALTLILGSAVSVLALSLIHYAMLEVRTAEQFDTFHNHFYLAETGIQAGIAVLEHNPGRRDSFKIPYNGSDYEEGAYEVTYLFRNTPYKEDSYLPRGYRRITDLKENEVFIVSRGTTGGAVNWESYHEIWALASKAPLYEPVLFVQRALTLKGLSKSDGEKDSQAGAGIYGSVHLNGSIIIDSSLWARNSFIRRNKESGPLPELSFSVIRPHSSFLNWHNTYGTPSLYVEKDEVTARAVYLEGEGFNGGGAFFLRYEPTDFGKRLSPRRAGFAEVAPLHFSYAEFRERLLSNAAETFPARMTELNGNFFWDNDSTGAFNDKITVVKGDLTVVNGIAGEEGTEDGGDSEIINPLVFEGVLIVDGTLTLKHTRRDDEGSVMQMKGIIMAENLICTFDGPDAISVDDADTVLQIEGLVVVEKRAELISAGIGDISLPADIRMLTGNLIAGEAFIQGPYTSLYHGKLEDITGEYYTLIPYTGYMIKKLFKPYMAN